MFFLYLQVFHIFFLGWRDLKRKFLAFSSFVNQSYNDSKSTSKKKKKKKTYTYGGLFWFLFLKIYSVRLVFV